MKHFLFPVIMTLALFSACTSDREPSGEFEQTKQERQTDSDMYSSEASVRESSP